jgi:hypothetical protein
MTRQELNEAIARLRRLNRDAAGTQASPYAERLLPLAAQYREAHRMCVDPGC